MTEAILTRFAPSPTGYLHMGHAYSALEAYNFAKKNNAELLLRIEDIDHTRCKPEFTHEIIKDLKWLGIEWKGDIWQQSQHMEGYKKALSSLNDMGLTYPCSCTRKDIKIQIQASANAPHGPDGFLYPGTCRGKNLMGNMDDVAIRLDMDKSIQYLKGQNLWPLFFEDKKRGKIKVDPESFGDIVLARKDIGTSYHLSVTLDDHLQNITHIIRGNDLFFATHIHRLLQALLELKVPKYDHHKLLMDNEDIRLAKREGSPTIKDFRENGGSREDYIAQINKAQKK